jgi:murein DD-endopeptidase MepM/ murein hydrolase activator NlpD
MTEKNGAEYRISPKKQGVRSAIAFLILMGTLLVPDVGLVKKWPWQRRVAKSVAVRHKLSYQKVRPKMWPPEPACPRDPKGDAFQKALGALCGQMPAERLATYAATILSAFKQYDIDPFLLAALMYHQSGCRPKTPDWETRYGLTRVDIDMHAPHVRSGEYRYFIKKGDTWHPHALSLGALRFNKWQMDKAIPNLTFAAAALSIFKKQCQDLDGAFGGKPHRHFVSHWFFGDRVRGSEPEDAVLTVRRRLLNYYENALPVAAGEFNGTPLVSPLDGAPRLVLDYFGNKRGIKGGPGHQGIDIAGLSGEPVRALAAGKVSFAGVDLKGNHPSRQTTPEEAAAISPGELGNGGLWITLSHGNGLRTCYMHLTTIAVTHGEAVDAGQIIGTLGNSGTRASGPHLHLEFRMDAGERVDPAPYLDSILVNPFSGKWTEQAD